MAVQTIAFARSALAAEPDHDTPAELPSGRASFEDAFGRETALRRGRERQEPPADEQDGEPARPRERVEPRSTNDSPEPDALELEELAAQFVEVPPEPIVAPSAREPEPELGSNDLETVDPKFAAIPIAEPSGASPIASPGTPSDPANAPILAPELAASGLETATLPTAEARPATAASNETIGAIASITANAATSQSAAREAAAPPSPTASQLDPTRASAAVERVVTLAELPRALQSEVDGFLELRQRGGRWEAELRLDPPELGALHVHLTMSSTSAHALHGVVRAEDPRLEPLLERMLKELEETLRQQGNDATFDFSRRPPEGRGEGRAFAPSAGVRSHARAGGAPRSHGGAGPAADRLVDVLA